MKTPNPRGRRQPGYVTRTAVMIVASLVVCVVVLGAVDAVTPRTTTVAAAVTAPPGASEHAAAATESSDGDGEEHLPASPELGPGLGQLGLQILLVAAIAFAGRKFLRIRL